MSVVEIARQMVGPEFDQVFVDEADVMEWAARQLDENEAGGNGWYCDLSIRQAHTLARLIVAILDGSPEAS